LFLVGQWKLILPGKDINQHQKFIVASKQFLHKAILHIKGGECVSEIRHLIETEGRKRGYKVMKDLTGHGIGRSLNEVPKEIANY
jgi:methionyl aminopeptidase